MSEKFQYKFRISSTRLPSWDYSRNADYFITVCTHDREHFFEEILNGKMHLNETGKIAEQLWIEIPDRFSFIETGNFVVMPNHIHGILIFNKDIETNGDVTPVETRLIASLLLPDSPPIINVTGGFAGNKNPMFHENISRIIRFYEGKCTFEIRKINSGFGWQSRFHDHIIRDSGSFKRIQYYIINNPFNWKDDKFFND